MRNLSRAALDASKLYGIVDLGYVGEPEIERAAEDLIEGGAGVLQLRAKQSSEVKILAMARRLLPICRGAEVPFVVNDYPAIAAEVGADAVHVGQDDGTIAEARSQGGGDILVGRSTHSLEQAEAAQAEGADYIGFGPLFATPTKEGRTAIGLDDVAGVHRRVTIPIFCIGGIKEHNLAEVVDAGARRVVIVSGLLCAEDRAATTRQCLEILP